MKNPYKTTAQAIASKTQEAHRILTSPFRHVADKSGRWSCWSSLQSAAQSQVSTTLIFSCPWAHHLGPRTLALEISGTFSTSNAYLSQKWRVEMMNCTLQSSASRRVLIVCWGLERLCCSRDFLSGNSPFDSVSLNPILLQSPVAGPSWSLFLLPLRLRDGLRKAVCAR